MMMKTMMAAVAVLAMTPGAVMAQAAAPAPEGVPVEAPLLAGATLAPTCGDLFGLTGKAFCVTAPLPAIGAIAEAYIAHFEGEGWLAAAGDENRVVFVKRREGGGCDGMQVQAFYDPNRPTGPEVPGYIAMATIPGNVCREETAAPVSPPAQ
jgi:hypothetical protein